MHNGLHHWKVSVVLFYFSHQIQHFQYLDMVSKLSERRGRKLKICSMLSSAGDSQESAISSEGLLARTQPC